SLAARNLLRGLRMGLPSGQDVACAMGLKPISDDRLVVGKATEEDRPVFKSLTAIPKFGSEFKEKAPLWFYVLSEAEQQFKNKDPPISPGQVVGTIGTETFVGLMLADSHSFL